MLPFVACAIQWLLWDTIKPFVWFLFFPTVFLSAWLGGLFGGIASALISSALVWYVFIPPQFSWTLNSFNNIYSVFMFIGMGILFGWVFALLDKTNRQLQESNAQITSLYEKTKELDTLKTQFFANVSHELRTPLALILGPITKLLRNDAYVEKSKDDLELIDRNARLLQRHVDELLDFAKLDAGKMVLDYVQTDIAAHVQMLASHFTNLASDRQIDFTVLAPGPVTAQVDLKKLHRIVLNILSNAFKFTPQNGHITLDLSQDDTFAKIVISDTGSGIPETKRTIIFEPFRQLDGCANRTYGGTGLGLAIAKEFAELHGGSISVGKNPSGGAEFTVLIPLKAPAGVTVIPDHFLETAIDDHFGIHQVVAELQTRAPNYTVQNLAVAKKPLILVVEDNTDMNNFICSVLHPRFDTVSAFNGAEGITAASNNNFDLIVSDIMMPGMSGDTMVAEIRSHEVIKEIPIIILTAKADDDLQISMLSNGVQDYIRKPFLPDELLARVAGLIDRRRMSSEKLVWSEHRYQELFENMTSGFALHEMIFDTDGSPKDYRFIDVNPAFEQLTGVKKEDILGKTLLEVMPATEKYWIDTYGKVVSTGEPIFFENYAAAIGKYFKSWAFRPSPGTFAVIFNDVTEQVHTVDELKQSESKFKALVEASPIGVYQTDEFGKCTFVNNKWCEIAGLAPDEAYGDGWSNALHPDDRPQIYEVWNKAAAENTLIRHEYRFKRRDGEISWVFGQAAPLHDSSDKITGFVGTIVDITERMKNEQELRHSYDLMNYIIKFNPSALAVHDKDLKYLFVSDRYLEDYKVQDRNIIGKHHYDVFPDLPQKWRDVHQKALAGIVSRAENDRYEKEDGSVEWTSWECRPWYEANGEVGGFVVYTEVVTDRLQAEEHRAKLQEQLHQSQKMEAIGQLAGGVAHDFNNILQVISGYCSLLQMDGALAQDQHTMILEVSAAAEKAAQLTHGLLTFSRKQPLSMKQVDLNDIIQHVHKFLKRIIGEDITLNTSCSGPELHVVADQGQIEQVMINLATNARDAMPDGGFFSITCELINLLSAVPDFQKCKIPPGKYAQLTVSDSGTGISKDHLEHIFEPFFTTKEVGKGTGLGMAIIYGIIKQHNGFIKVYSELGKGTTFQIYLPIHESTDMPDWEQKVIEPPMKGSETILVAEDEPAVRTLVSRVLENYGYETIVAEDGEDAVDKFRVNQEKIALVLMDVIMPKKNGHEACEEIRRLQPGIKVLFSSGYTADFIENRGVSQENTDLLMKPVQPMEMLRKVREMLDK